MNLAIDKDQGTLTIQLSIAERLLAVRLKRDITIPLRNIVAVSTERPESSALDLRVPGTYVPGLIKAGTYYTRGGREFWYATRKKTYLVLDLKDARFRRVVLTVDDNEAWADQLRPAS
jgi:hypothetical protein